MCPHVPSAVNTLSFSAPFAPSAVNLFPRPTMPRTHSLFPDPVCRHPDEYGFVCAILAAPLDDLPKLVYADWLDEHADPRGMFLRQWLAARQAGKKLPKPDKSVSACWLSVMGFTLDAWLAKQGNPAWGEVVKATAAPGVMVRTVRLNDGETLPAGRSKMGGLPDLDPDTEWPLGEEGECAMVAQWNLAELAVTPCCAKLPREGVLSFFLDLQPFVEDWGQGRAEVVFNPTPSELSEREPEDLHESNELRECRVEFREWLSVPDYRSPVLKKVMSDAERAAYREYYFSEFTQPQGAHRILAHAWPIQNDPSPAGRTKWELLTEFGPDEVLNLEAGDGGTWYFMAPAADLKKGKFEDVAMEFQTG
jgi:uncharacterized protein (TIGR02996 family)